MCIVFFFQAEDGIRDLVRSRGLGDVYKRQDSWWHKNCSMRNPHNGAAISVAMSFPARAHNPESVSYTHLTLPTSDLV